MRTITLSLPGKPTAKARPRFAVRKGRPVAYSSQKDEEETMKWKLKARVGSMLPMDGPLSVSTIFVFKPPKSWPKSRCKRYHSVKPDVDNCLKWICDVGNTILWYDDSQIAECWAMKIYGAEAKTIITVRQLEKWE